MSNQRLIYRSLMLILSAAASCYAQPAHITCTNSASSATGSAPGPNGISAVVTISTSDDYGKNSHSCEAEYHLVITSADHSPVSMDLLTSDDEYGRHIFARLDGFSRDGKYIFGILSEAGEHPTAMLFAHDNADQTTQLADLRKYFPGLIAANCGPGFGVVGNTEAGAIVLQASSERQCGNGRRWLFDTGGNKISALPAGTSILTLHKSSVDKH